MPKFIEKHTQIPILGIPEDDMQRFATWIYNSIEDALASRKIWESVLRECLRQYEGVPKEISRDIPIPNAPNLEITIGAISVDTLNAQAIDLIFGTSPLATVRPKPNFKEDKETVATAKAMQRLVNHYATSEEVAFRDAVEDSVLDDIQLGTGSFYVPFVIKKRKTKTEKVICKGPRVYSIAPEDVIVPNGYWKSYDEMPFVGVRFTKTWGELAAAAKEGNWDLEGVEPVEARSWVRTEREALGRQTQGIEVQGKFVEIIDFYCDYDIDGDGYEEDLHVIWNHTARKILRFGFNGMDRRPLPRSMVYQRRAHLAYGMGVMEMLREYENALSDVHSYALLNMLLANSRVWSGSEDLGESIEIWPGKFIPTADPEKGLKPLQMADIYGSIWQEQYALMQLANQRVGINDLSSPDKIPNRTPGITTMSFLQQVNKRFAPAFDSMRRSVADALRHCLYRVQERVRAGDKSAELMVIQVLGYEDAQLVLSAFERDSFDEQVDIELTAASSSINQEADRQNAILLTNLLGQYYSRTLQLVGIASNPQTAPEVREVARKIAESAGEIIERTIATFDQVRDPRAFIIEVDDQMNQLEQNMGVPQQAMQALFAQLMGGGPQKPLELPERTMG